MADAEAREQLDRLLDGYTVGSVLHLLAEVVREHGDAARVAGDEAGSERHRQVEATLFVAGIGIDAVLPA